MAFVSVDFIFIDMDSTVYSPIILGRPFFITTSDIIDEK
jgi:hypothetical protein